MAEYNRKKGKGKGATERPKKPEEPAMAQVFTTDGTLEALSVLLHQNRRGLAFVRDELTGWARAMNQYRSGRGADRQAWLSFWSGAEHLVNREGLKEALLLLDPFLCVAGCLPPDVLDELADERGREDGRGPAVDLYAPIPHGDGQTVLREAMLVADHNAYHVGQLVLIRRLLKVWPRQEHVVV